MLKYTQTIESLLTSSDPSTHTPTLLSTLKMSHS